jgi:CMP/dCMP kinase
MNAVFRVPRSALRVSMIVTIDGPSGVGKSTVTKQLAARLGFECLDTGAMYRAVALAGLRAGTNLSDRAAVEAMLSGLHVLLPVGRVLLNGDDVTTAIRTPDVSQGASKVAAVPAVRRFLVARQRETAAGRDMVCEGRDQGTFVFPCAEHKFYLVADPLIRAERRAAELCAKGQHTTAAEQMREQDERDRRDAERDTAPMHPARDALVIDTSLRALASVVALLESVVRR